MSDLKDNILASGGIPASPEPESVRQPNVFAIEHLAQWDRGESVWTIEMGGLGPGYEQALQILAVEIVRDELNNPLPQKEYGKWGDATVERIDQRDPVTGKYACGGFSGAQVGAAKQIAYRLLRDGQEWLKAAPDGRKIQVSRFFPAAPKPVNVARSEQIQVADRGKAKTKEGAK